MSSKHTYTKRLVFVPPPNPHHPHAREWLYDEIMRNIEPDLMLGTVWRLDERYKGETPAERATRLQAYDRAFEIFDQIYQDVSAHVAADAFTLKERTRTDLRAKEDKERAQDAARAEENLSHADE